VPDKPWGSEEELLARLRSGDREGFATLVGDMQGRLLALARTFTSSSSLAEDIVQETWLAVIRGLRGFEGRSSLRTWIFSILVHRAKTLASRDARNRRIVMRANGSEDSSDSEWEPGRGRRGLWEEAPKPWVTADPAELVQSLEVLAIARNAVESLPEAQRQVVILRDVEDVPPTEICNILGISETNQRVLLHRGRARIRRALDAYLREGAAPEPKTKSRIDRRPPVEAHRLAAGQRVSIQANGGGI